MVALPLLTQHGIVQAHIDHGFEVQQAKVALWGRGMAYEASPYLSPLPGYLPRAPPYLQPLCGAHTPKVTSIPADEEKTSSRLEAWGQSGEGEWARLGSKQRHPLLLVVLCPSPLGSLLPSHQVPNPALGLF